MLIDREVPIQERTAFLAKFNLTAGVNGVLDGVPVIKDFVPKNQTEKKMLNLIEKFYQNETIIASAGEKHCIDSIL